jgi:phosphatidate phosphatase APP1
MGWLARVEALEHGVDAVFRNVRMRVGAARPPSLVPFGGWVSGGRAHVRGRVLASPQRFTPHAPALVTLRETLRAFAGIELPGVAVTVSSAQAAVECVSDADGYITASVPVPVSPAPCSFLRLSVEGGRAVEACAYRVPDHVRWLVISDIDDTLLRTRTWSIPGALWLTLTADAAERRAVRGMPAVIKALHVGAGGGPVFYVSSSPWNLHRPLEVFLDRTGLPPGPLVLTDLGLTDRQLFSAAPRRHKISSIEKILEHFPQPVVLVGDTSQEDAAAYAEVALRHPGRVRAVLLRAAPARPGNRRRAEGLAGEVRRTGTLFSVGGAATLRNAAGEAGLFGSAPR